MSRRYINAETQVSVLMLSRRRCALCHGLHDDHAVKAGQIAHINRDSADARLENLAFLCLAHHDQYDSRTNQSKGFTPEELRRYRDKLYESFNREEPLSLKPDGFFSEWVTLIPQKWHHVYEEALDFYTSPHRTQSAVLCTLASPRTLQEMVSEIPPNDVDWTKAIVEGAMKVGWLQRSKRLPDSYEATLRARVLVEALADFPEAVKDAAGEKIWRGD